MPNTILWHGQKVHRTRGTLRDIRSVLPMFDRTPFALGESGVNPYLDQIISLPLAKGEPPIPVAAVSQYYELIQHHAVLDWIIDGLEKARIHPNEVAFQLWKSDFGERIRLLAYIPGERSEPGGRYPLGLVLECVNSVDKSCAFEILVHWQRKSRATALIATLRRRHRKVHNALWMNRESVARHVAEQLGHAAEDLKIFRTWQNTRLTWQDIEMWATKTLAKWWGIQLATRAFYISQSGWDGQVRDLSPALALSKRRVSEEERIPEWDGPVDDAYGLAQVLSWLADREPSVQARISKTRDVPLLIDLLPS